MDEVHALITLAGRHEIIRGVLAFGYMRVGEEWKIVYLVARDGDLRHDFSFERTRKPQSRPMPSIGLRCHELRIPDVDVTWRIVYRFDDDALVIAEVFAKKPQSTPRQVIERCRHRLSQYDVASTEEH